MQQVYILSDGTGGTAERALKAAIAQFGDPEVNIKIFSEIQTSEQVTQVISEAAKLNALVIHTFVSQDLRYAVTETGRLHNIRTIDLIGPILTNLTQMFSYLPSEEPGLFRKLNKEYFQRIEAMEFALRHDDGQRSDELEKSDMVLLGVSRTFKTPLCIYFAFKGWMIGNVPVIYNLPIPDILNKLPPEKIICLTTDPYSLAKLRKVRHDYLGGATGEYAELEYVRKELAYARYWFNLHPNWSVVQVTNKPIEEIAVEILDLFRKNKKKQIQTNKNKIDEQNNRTN